MKRSYLLLTLLTLLILTAAGVQAQSEPETLRLAYIGATEGTQAQTDRQAYQAAVLAAEQISADGGYLETADGSRYVFEVAYYEADSPDEAADAYTEALDDEAVAILGLNQTSHLDEVLAAGALSVPVLTTNTGTAVAVGLYRLTTPQDTQTEAVADYLLNERYFTSFALAAVDTETAQDGVAVLTTTLGSENVVLALTHAADETDFTADARAIRDSDADALVIWTLDTQGRLLLEALREVGWTGFIAYMDLDAGFINQAGADLTTSLIGPAGWSPVAYDAVSQAFVADYTERYGQAPTASNAPYFDAVNWLAATVEATGADLTTGTPGQTEFSGVQGTYTGGAITSLRLLEATATGSLIELARYTDALTCATCPDLWSADITAETFADSTVFTLALIAPLDGVNEASGRHAQQAAELAVREINDAGGFVGADGVRYRLQLRVYGAITAQETQQVFQQAVDDGAQLVMGPDFNAQVLPNLLLAQTSGTPQFVSATGLSSNLVSVPDLVFQLRPGDATLAAAAAAYLLDVREVVRVATVAARTDYGLDSTRVIQDAVAASEDGRLVLSVEHNITASDQEIAAIAGQIADSGAEAVFVWSSQPATASLLSELGKLGWQGVVVAGYLTPEFVSGITVPASIELLGPVSWWSAAQDWSGVTFRQRYFDRYDEQPDVQSAAYYDAIYLVRAAIQNAGAETTDLLTWLSDELSFIGVQGTYAPAITSQDELSRAVLLIQVTADGVREISRYNDGVCLVYCD